MGLFDAFGVGGGKMTVRLDSSQVSPGGMVTGSATFKAGSRPQQVTKIMATLTCNLTQMQQTPQGPQQRTESIKMGELPLSGPMQTAPDQSYEFRIQMQLPPNAMSSTPSVCTYRLSVSADIDGEIDPGAGADVHVVGGMMPGMQPGMMQPGMMQPGMQPGMMNPGMMQPGMQPGMMNPGMQPGMMNPGMMQPGMQPGMMHAGMQPGMMSAGMTPMQPTPMQPAMMSVGAPVMAQWQDGNWHPGRIAAMQNGMFGVDWDNPALGASSWVQQHQIQGAGAGPAPMMTPQKADPNFKGPPMGGMLSVGGACLAQWQDGNWYPARVAAMQDGMYGVDWDDPNLGQSTWVAAHQIRTS